MERDAAPAGVVRSHALGRLRGSARWPLRAGREEFADREAPMPSAKRGPEPVVVSRETRAIAAVERREACAPDHGARRAS